MGAGEPEARAEAPRRDPLYRRLVWLTLFRLVLVTVLLGGAALVGWRQARDAEGISTPIY